MTTPNQCQFWDCAEIIRRNHFLCALHYEGYEMGLVNQCPSCGQYKDAEYDVCLVCYRQPAAAPRTSASAAAPRAGASDAALLEELRGLRRSMARRDGLQEFMVFSNDTLEQLATMRPATAEAMLTVNGVGPVKMERYGADVLGVIRASVSAPSGRESRRPAAAAATTVERDNREFAADKDADRFFVYILLLNGPNGGEYYIGQTREIDERMHEHLNGMSKSTAGREPKLQWFTTVDTRPEATALEQELERLNRHPADRRQITRLVADFKKLATHLDYTPHQSTAQPAERERLPYGGVSPPSSRRGRR